MSSNKFTIAWLDRGREPTEKPNPAFPLGIDLDITQGQEPACKDGAALPCQAVRPVLRRMPGMPDQLRGHDSRPARRPAIAQARLQVWRAGVTTLEFVCEDCGKNIVSFGALDTLPVCGVCRFLRAIEDPEEREKVRQHLRHDRSDLSE